MGTHVRIQAILCFLAFGLQFANSAVTLTNLLKDKYEMYSALRAIQSDVDQAIGLERFINAVKDLQISARKFFDSPLLTGSRHDLNLLYNAIHAKDELLEFEEYTGLRSSALKANNYFRLNSFYKLLTSSIYFKNEIRKDSFCKDLIDTDQFYSAAGLTIQNICPNSLVCSNSKYLFPYRCDVEDCSDTTSKELFYEQELAPACTASKQCNVKKALPMMAGVFWYQINEMVFQRFCPQKCKGPCNYATTFQTLMRDAEALIMFAETLPSHWSSKWKPFFIKAIHTFTSIETAAAWIEANMAAIQYAEKQCSVIKFPNACSIVDVKDTYAMLNRFGKERLSSRTVKDLRAYSEIDLATIEKGQFSVPRHFSTDQKLG